MDFLINPPQYTHELFGVDNSRFTPMQSGRGVFGFFGKLLKGLIPLGKKLFRNLAPIASAVASNSTVQKLASDLKDHAIDAGINIATNVVSGNDVKEGLMQDLEAVKQTTIKRAKEFIKKPGKKRSLSGATRHLPKKKKKKKKKNRDLFG
jgi:hypothetical protein